MVYRTIDRALKELVIKETLVQERWGQYWLPEYHANCIRNLRRLGDFDSIKEVSIHIIDALRYCESDEDWELLEAFFAKMNENRRDRDRAEYEEADQKLRDKVLEELERKGKSSNL